MTATDYPPTYRPLAERHGHPATVEEARASWGRIVKGAEAGGTITLIARNGPAGPDWAAVVPLTEVAEPGRCPVWPLSTARARLGEVVDAAGTFLGPVPQILTRHRQPVAAVIDARMLTDLPDAGERIDLAAFLEDGGTLTLAFEPGQSGACNEEGDVTDEPIEPAFVATARDWEGKQVGVGAGTTLAEALIRVCRRPATFLGSGDGDPWAGPFDDEPPF